MSDRIANWWRIYGGLAVSIPKPVWDELDAAIRSDEKAKCIAAVEASNERCEHFGGGMSLYDGGAYIRVTSATEAIQHA